MSVAQLNAARELIKSDPQQYPSLVRGVLPIGDRPEPEIRLWCSGFVADFFGSDQIDSITKDQIASEVLDILDTWITDDDRGVTKLGICILSEVYQRIYRMTCYEGLSQKSNWDKAVSLKTKALARWTPQEKEGVVIACIKFAQVVVLVHQQIPRPHPVLDHVLLTAEAAGLLDRLLSVFPNDSQETFGVLSATLNAVVSLALAQPQLSPRVVSYIMTFDLSKRSLGTPEQLPLTLKWTSKLFKLALHPLSRNFPQLQKYLNGLRSYCANESLKRRAEDEGDSPSKRPKLSRNELPPGPQPYKALYTLVDNMMAAFYARDLDFNLAVSMAFAGLKKVEVSDLETCVSAIKQRLAKIEPTEVPSLNKTSTGSLSSSPAVPSNVAATASTSAAGATEPAAQPTADSAANTAAGTAGGTADSSGAPSAAASAAAAAGEASADEKNEKPRGPSRAALEIKAPPEFKKFDFILNRLLTDAPIRLVARLSARGLPDGSEIKKFCQRKLYAQLVPDFRSSLEPLVLWLSEEYYADSRDEYFDLVSRVVDEIIPKLEITDSRLFVRLLSELPELNRDIIFKIRSSCLDPERSVVGARALKFLIMFKPPCRNDCLDLVEQLVSEGVQSVKGILERYRPKAVENSSESSAGGSIEGSKEGQTATAPTE